MKEKKKELAKKYKEKEIFDFVENCTFTPNITTKVSKLNLAQTPERKKSLKKIDLPIKKMLNSK